MPGGSQCPNPTQAPLLKKYIYSPRNEHGQGVGGVSAPKRGALGDAAGPGGAHRDPPSLSLSGEGHTPLLVGNGDHPLVAGNGETPPPHSKQGEAAPPLCRRRGLPPTFVSPPNVNLGGGGRIWAQSPPTPPSEDQSPPRFWGGGGVSQPRPSLTCWTMRARTARASLDVCPWGGGRGRSGSISGGGNPSGSSNGMRRRRAMLWRIQQAKKI